MIDDYPDILKAEKACLRLQPVLFTRLLTGVVLFILGASSALGYRVMPSLNTYRQDVAGVGELKADGVWAITKNTDFTDAEWRTVFETLGGALALEENPNSTQSFDDYVRIMSAEPDGDIMCYNETGGDPGGTLLTDPQIDERYAYYGRPVMAMTRSYGGAWKKETDRCLANPKVNGIVMEYVKGAWLEDKNAPRQCIQAIMAAGKRCYIILKGGDGWTDAENRQIIENLNSWVPGAMASDDMIIVYQLYHGDEAGWFGPENSIQSSIIQATSMPNYSGAGYRSRRASGLRLR